MTDTQVTPLARERRHTLAFLANARSAGAVYLDTEVDATALTEHQRRADRKISVVTYVMSALARTLTEYPQANATIGGLWESEVTMHRTVDVKLALDKTINDVRCAASAVVPDVAAMSLDQIQDQVERLRDTAAEELDELAGIRTLHRLPLSVARLVFAAVTRRSGGPARLGTVAVSSLGHAEVARFFSYGGTTVTIGLGRITRKPVAVTVDGTEQIVVRPVLPLSLTFDHRVIDGALAADVLSALAGHLREPDSEQP
ncbi:2-oxo acid dehydrogenase subunit E2 [Nocardia sp. NPDC058705]|uniref:2-oxo acid dehydrogenase subunit E2 n=1 Tax=Nocardia sp. NPDC058705 TaxID=3346609 RepID=UPI003698DBDF